jgi:hypothetical protein
MNDQDKVESLCCNLNKKPFVATLSIGPLGENKPKKSNPFKNDQKVIKNDTL